MINVAILEAGHWHVPLYLQALSEKNIHVLAISDNTGTRGLEIAEQFGARLYTDYQELLEKENIDFAFAFGRHCDMAKIAHALIERNIPFSIEKPVGINTAEVAQLKTFSNTKDLFVSIPFIFRFSQLLKNLEILEPPCSSEWNHISFRFIAGPLDRYRNVNCGWLLENKLAAGGCSINLAVHFIDLSMKLLSEEFAFVSAQMIESPGQADVEIFSTMTLTTHSGRLCNIETGYTYPGGSSDQREFSFSLSSVKHYVRSQSDGMLVIARDSPDPQQIKFSLETDDYYDVYVRHTLKEFQSGQNPSVGLIHMERVMKVIDCAYASAEQGGKPIAIG